MLNTQLPLKRLRLWRVVAMVLFLLLATYLLMRHSSQVCNSFLVLERARPGWILTGLGLTLLTFVLAAAIYSLLAIRPLRYQQTLLVELAAAFANRLLPAGIGGLGLHGLYLYKKHHSAPQATAVISVNNLLGITAHSALLLAVVSIYPRTLDHLRFSRVTPSWWYLMIISSAALALLCWPSVRHRLVAFMRNLLASVRLLSFRRLMLATVLASGLTITYTLVLFTAAHAVKLQLGLLEIFVVFSLGMLASTATPTPGGLVGAEAGLFAGFVAYGMPVVGAGAAVVLFRLLTYWLPLLPGVVALIIVRQKNLV